jgi:hypothetical protein
MAEVISVFIGTLLIHLVVFIKSGIKILSWEYFAKWLILTIAIIIINIAW